MSSSPEPVMPEAKVVPKRRLSVVWIVPLVAAVLAGGLYYRGVVQAGPEITIRFNDGNGLKSGQTAIKYRGITVGMVEEVTFKDQKHIAVRAQLDKSAEFLAREGSSFWIVRPEISVDAVRGLGTLITGPYIQASPGHGEPAKEFVGAEKPPLTELHAGLDLVLMAGQLGFLKPGSPIYYRGIEVGAVQKIDLATNARVVHIYATVDKVYAPLVRTDTRFWNAGGVDVNFSLFRGLEMSAETFKSLVSGGIAFATPEISPTGKQASNGMIFRLYERPEEAWLQWSPLIPLKLDE